jgi:secreted protein with Ig-like and vWFA domain
MRFSSPLALLLLLLAPVFMALGWPRRGFGMRREALGLAIRLVILVCLVFSLAGLQIIGVRRNLAVVFLIDFSDSISPQARKDEVNAVRQAIENMPADDQAAIVVFGADALVERLMSNSHSLDQVQSIPQSSQTNIAKAIQLGLALFPPGSARRMVLLSDGAATAGDANAAARLAAASGVQILALPVPQENGPEALVQEVRAPKRLHPGDNFDLEITIQSSQAMQAGLRVLAAGQVVYEGSRQIQRGLQTFSLPLTASGKAFSNASFVRFEVQIDPEQDGYYQNNAQAAFSLLEGPAKILLVAPPPGEEFPGSQEPRPDEAGPLLRALQATNYKVEQISPGRLPVELSELASYAGLVFVDAPARDLSERQMQAVQSYVRDLGGGLVVVGGPTSFGVGGYFHTPLEATLPVDMQIKDQQRRPSLTMVFIIDHSGSMGELSGGVSKLELAKEAAIRSVEMLYPGDRAGVIAFDDSASWVVNPTVLSDPQEVIRRIGTIRSGGGTDILAGLQLMAQTLPDDPATLKHVILLTDGGADPTGISELIQQLNQQDGISLTTVGVGLDAADFLPKLAELGSGRYYYAADPASIPNIFTQETSLASRAYLIEQNFVPRQVSASPILTGIQAFPELRGYVGTSAKPLAQTILVSNLGDPILAAWQYGLGKAVAFTSDASGRWAANWVGWKDFAAFWSQTLAFATAGQPASPLSFQATQQGEDVDLSVEAQSESGNYLNGYQMTASIVAPDGITQTVDLQQVAPGRYQAALPAGQPGAYWAGILAIPPDSASPEATLKDTAGWVQSYSPEYHNLQPEPQALARLSAMAGGGVIQDDAQSIFSHDLAATSASRPVWPWLLAAAAILLPLDVAVRRLALSRQDLSRFRERLSDRLIPARRKGPPPMRSERIDALLQAKQRVIYPAGQEENRPRIIEAGDDAKDRLAASAYNKGRPNLPPEKSSTEPEETSEGSPPDQTTTAASLLAAKRDRQKKR